MKRVKYPKEGWMICGDAWRVLPKLKESSVDFVFIDPHYSLNRVCKSKLKFKGREDLNKVADWDKDTPIDDTLLHSIRRVLKPGGNVAIWCAYHQWGAYHSLFDKRLNPDEAAFDTVMPFTWAKCLAGNTRVYAKKHGNIHSTNVRDLYDNAKGDYSDIQLWDGVKWTDCVSMTKNEKSNRSSITLKSGEKISCTKDHKWPVIGKGNLRTDELQIGDRLETCKLPDCHVSRTSWLSNRHIGWLIGTFLADGSFVGTDKKKITISSHKNETIRFSRLRYICRKLNISCSIEQAGSENGLEFRIYGKVAKALIEEHISGTDAYTKGLRNKVWEHDNTFLRGLLLGYLQGDGHRYSTSRSLWKFGFCRNRNLENSLRTICARLGFDITISPRESVNTVTGKEHLFYRGFIRALCDDFNKRWFRNEISDIRLNDRGKMTSYDISVRSAKHLFALSSGVLSHNSNPPPSLRKSNLRQATEWVMIARDKKAFINFKKQNEMLNWISNPICMGNERVKGSDGKTLHPTQKPLKVYKHLIDIYCPEGGLVLDFFSGVGTTAVACRELNRKFICVELNETYHNAAIDRLDSFVYPPNTSL